MTVTALAGIVMIGIIFVTLAVGFPIGLSIGLGSAAGMVIIMPQMSSMMVSAQKMFQSVNSFSLLAIPFFVLAGNLMNFGGIAAVWLAAPSWLPTGSPLPGPDQHRCKHALRRHVRFRRCRSRCHGRYPWTS